MPTIFVVYILPDDIHDTPVICRMTSNEVAMYHASECILMIPPIGWDCE